MKGFGNLLTVANAKTIKGEKLGYLTGILYMSPERQGPDGRNMCEYSTPGCRAGCLNTAGRGTFSNVQAGRARKRALFVAYPTEFVLHLHVEIAALQRRAKHLGMRPVVRLNGTTDLDWPTIAPSLFTAFPRVKFYDYTKHAPRMTAPRPANYDLTYSRAEGRDAAARAVLAHGGRVAVVFSTRRGQPLPKLWEDYRVKDGDRHDLRFLERSGVVGLRAKGRARYDRSGFVVTA